MRARCKIKTMELKTIRILFTGGGSGGHTYPLLAVGEALKKIAGDKINPELYYMGPFDEYSEILDAAGFRIKTIVSGKLRRYFSLENIIDIPKFMLAHELVGDYLRIYAEAVAGEDVWIKLVRIDNRYSHSNTVDMAGDCVDPVMDEMRGSFTAYALQVCRGYMNGLYKDFERAWEGESSDENIAEACKANEWYFDEKGRVI